MGARLPVGSAPVKQLAGAAIYIIASVVLAVSALFAGLAIVRMLV